MAIGLSFFGDFKKIDEIFQAFITNPSHGYMLNLFYNKQRTHKKNHFKMEAISCCQNAITHQELNEIQPSPTHFPNPTRENMIAREVPVKINSSQ